MNRNAAEVRLGEALERVVDDTSLVSERKTDTFVMTRRFDDGAERGTGC